jgi:aconitate hydratase
VATQFASLFSKPNSENGFNQPAAMLATRHLLRHSDNDRADLVPGVPPTALGAPRMVAEMEGSRPTLASSVSAHAEAPASKATGISIGNGDVLIAAITSCTNTSNPSVLLAAGLLAKKAVQAGLKVQSHIKTSLAPGSRIVTEYLTETGLLPYLEKLGFAVAGYGCTTCIGNAGDLTPEINEAITKSDLVCAAVLSGNRNFEARIHPNLKANFLASPPLVVAYAITGTVMRDLMTEPVGKGKGGKDVYLGDIWPTTDEINALMKYAMNGKAFRANYAKVKTEPGKLWEKIKGVTGNTYTWPTSTYIAEPPFFKDFAMDTEAARASNIRATAINDAENTLFNVRSARIMALFGDSITTDHISPAGSIKASSPAGQWHDVMMRGTFANVRIKNLMIPADAEGSREEGGVTLFQSKKLQGSLAAPEKMFIYDAAMRYMAEGTPTVIFAGEEYGTGSSRDWAAKGTQLLGIKAVVARSFERIHRSNLVGMGVLPLQFKAGQSWQTLGLTGNEVIDVIPHPALKPQSDATLRITRADGQVQEVIVTLRVDTPIEVDYYQSGGILPYVLRQLLAE